VSEITIRLPVAPPEVYRRYLDWWRALEAVVAEEAAHTSTSMLIPGQAADLKAQVDAAWAEGRSEVAPTVSGDALIWRIALSHSDRRDRWLEEAAGTRPEIPTLDPEAAALRERILEAIRERLSESIQLLDILPGGDPGMFRLLGELDLTNADTLRTALESELDLGNRLALDLTDVAFMDSNGIRLLISIGRRARAAGVDPVVLTSLSAAVRRVLEVAVPDGVPGVVIQ
jgi:anti-anti-sigma factor